MAQSIFSIPPRTEKLFEWFKAQGVVFDGFVDARGVKDEKYNFVTAEQAIAERAFLLIPTPYYDDGFFDLLNDLGCQYERDYLIVPPELL